MALGQGHNNVKSFSSQTFPFMGIFVLVEDLRVTSDKDQKMPECFLLHIIDAQPVMAHDRDRQKMCLNVF